MRTVVGLDYKVLYKPSEPEEKALAKASAGKVKWAVLAFLDDWTRHSFVDDEVLSYAGVVVGKRRGNRIDRAVAEWLRQAPDSRCEIASSFLWGYWRVARDLDLHAVADLRKAADDLKNKKESGAYRATLLALYSAATSNRLGQHKRGEIRNLLLEHLSVLEQSHLHKGVASLLVKLRRKNGGTRNRTPRIDEESKSTAECAQPAEVDPERSR